MSAVLIPAFAIWILLTPIVCFVWQFQKVRKRHSSPIRGALRYAAWSATPVILFIGFFFLLIAVEEIFDLSLVSEEYARSLVLIGGGGLALVVLGTIAFLISVTLSKSESA